MSVLSWMSELMRSATPVHLSREVTDDGILLYTDTGPQSASIVAGDGAIGYLQQLAGEGRLEEKNQGLLLSWDEVYEILDTASGALELALLGLPPVRQFAPRLRSEGSLTSEDFAIAIDGWRDGNGVDRDDVSCIGGFVYVGEEQVLLPKSTYRVMRKIREFYDTERRNADVNRMFWGALREVAVEAGAVLDQFLFSNVILTPEKLHIELQKSSPGNVGVVEIEPWFAGAPDNWLDIFDRFTNVRDLYEIPTENGIVQVVLTPKVKGVLQAIKRMPGRRVAGALGERFVTNPFATLGEAAQGVIDPEQFEQARTEAGITFKRFTASVNVDANGAPTRVGVLVQTIGDSEAASQFEAFADATDLRWFMTGVDTRISTGNEIYHWRGHDLQLLGDTLTELQTLNLAYTEWVRQRISIRYAEVSDLKRYSLRIEGIGIQKPITSPYIPRQGLDIDDAKGGGQKAVRTVVINLTDDSGGLVETLVAPADLGIVDALIKEAKQSGRTTIKWPETGTLINIVEAEDTVNEVRRAWEVDTARSESPSPEPGTRPSRKGPRQELLFRANVESAVYQENRAQQLKFDARTKPSIPSTLLPDTKLKDHQEVGVAWLQNLIEQAPDYCRGAVLADDMGLGKTLQLLTVIASFIAEHSDAKPVLIVAPVSLLENWKEEVERFFKKDTFRLLMLYGETLGGLKAGLSSLDDELVANGLVRFLKPDWLGNHNVVLTTYETMRDLEFSLAAIHWSIMVCDEAQRIKNPAAMVTRSAMKQNVDFKIACTGTPVENSLADLWSLFDYIQPGLLGGLNEFGGKYRRPIECAGDPDAQARIEELRSIIEPQVLRRTKKQVATELPPKIVVEDALNLPMSAFQKRLYAEALEAYRNRNTGKGPEQFKSVLTLIHFLRRVCTDPKEVGRNVFVPLPLSDYRQRSPKLSWLLDTLAKIKERGDKAIVFCEFREMQRMLVHYIEDVFNYRPDVINGDTTTSPKHELSRQKRIKAFQARPGFGVIILSPVAVGFGVNIQAANHVIHFSRTWNPAREDQATDRAYRIGQTKTVYVYYPVVRASEFKSFDVKLHDLLEYKRSLSDDMLNGTGNVMPNEFEDVVSVGNVKFEDIVDLDVALSLQADYFEALSATLWAKKGFKYVERTPASNDDGVDVVAKSQKVGELVQCKSSTVQGEELDWDAVKDIVTGHAVYKLKYPGTHFKLYCITNQFFNSKAHKAAKLHGVELIEQPGLKALLETYSVSLKDLERFLDESVLAN